MEPTAISSPAESFHAFARFFRDPALLLARDGTIVAANEAAVSVGLAPGQDLHEIAERPSELAQYLRIGLRVSVPVPGRLTLLLQGEQVHWGALVGRWSANPDEPAHIVLRLSDGLNARHEFAELTRRVDALNAEIHRRHAAEEALRESEAKLRLLADTIPQLAWMARPDGHIFWYNRRWFEYTGTTPQDMEGWGWQSVHDPDVLPVVLERWRGSITSGEPFEMVFPLRGADGVLRPFLTRVNPLKDGDGRVLHWFGTNTDITELRRMEQELRDADRRKNEFLATLAHELRNPLAPIRNALELMQVPEPREVAQDARALIERQVHHMVRLVDDLMDVSRITSGKLSLRRERIVLQDVVSQAIEASRPQLDGHDFTLSLPAAPIHVRGDAVRLAQVLSNLLTNACKYTPRRGQVRLTAERRGDIAEVRVQDTGIGIPAEHLPRIFEMFSQVEPALDRTHGGLGIGLSLARALVHMHDGEIEAHSAGTGEGSEFIVRLPVLQNVSPSIQGPAIGTDERPLTARRILVSDDNRDAADSLAEILRFQGNDVVTAYDGAQSVELAARFRPDAVLLDIGMPKLNGYEACRRIRAETWGRDVVLVAISGWGQQEDRARAKAAGFDVHLTKPVEPARLLRLLASLLRQRTPV